MKQIHPFNNPAHKHSHDVLKEFDWLMNHSGNPLTAEEIIQQFEKAQHHFWYIRGYYARAKAGRL